ncbi:MAG: hypothetical protein R3D57_19280 [Hyphomicrobiaceae bacterium]
MPLPLTSSLNDTRNDTGRTAYCGPTVVSAITGYSVASVEAAINSYRETDEARARMIKGTTAADVSAALAMFGYEMRAAGTFTHLAVKERPTVWQWMQRPRSAWTYFLLGIRAGRTGHWIVVKGAKLLDTYTKGTWVFVATGPHRGARIEEIFEVRRAQP